MSNYSAIVCRAGQVRKHPNADRLNLATVQGNQVVVDLSTTEGTLGVFFPTDGELSHEYCVANNLYTASARARLGLPEGPVGFFDYKRRVRAQRFRGERSDGIWLGLETLLWAEDTSTLREGDQLTEFGGHQICTKYLTPATKRAMAGQGKSPNQRELKQFPKHDVTKQFRYYVDQIPEDAIIYITEKLHGTQGRYAHVLDKVELPGWKRFLNTYVFRSGYFKYGEEYRHLNGSKNVILEKSDGAGWYGTNEFREAATEGLTLHKGEAIYFEIVGWADGDVPIMPPHDVTKTGLKDIKAQYGDTIRYTYACPEGQSRVYVYKITRANEDGVVVDLSWPQVVARCGELGLAHVPLLVGPLVVSKAEKLQRWVEKYTDGPSTLNDKQIREGVVVRVESMLGTSYLKNKSFVFGVLEGYLAENEEFVDPEDVS